MRSRTATLALAMATFLLSAAAAAAGDDPPILIRSAPVEVPPGATLTVPGTLAPPTVDDATDDAARAAPGPVERQGRHRRRSASLRHERREASSPHRHAAPVSAEIPAFVPVEPDHPVFVPGGAQQPDAAPVMSFEAVQLRVWRVEGGVVLHAGPYDAAAAISAPPEGTDMPVLGRVAGTGWFALADGGGVAFARIPLSPAPRPAPASACPIG